MKNRPGKVYKQVRARAREGSQNAVRINRDVRNAESSVNADGLERELNAVATVAHAHGYSKAKAFEHACAVCSDDLRKLFSEAYERGEVLIARGFGMDCRTPKKG